MKIRQEDYNQINKEKDEMKIFLADYLTKKGINIYSNFQCLNPNHNETRPSMGFNRVTNTCHCFACNATYDIYSLVGLDYNEPNFFKQILKVKELYQNKKIEEIKTIKDSIGINNTDSKELDLDAQFEYYHRELLKNPDKIKHYTDRGLSMRIIRQYKLGYSKDGHNALLEDYPEYKSKTFKENLYNYIYPYFDIDGFGYYYCSEISDRNLTDDYNSKYKKINKGPIASPKVYCPIFNERYLLEDTPDILFVTEGIIDALSIEEVGGKAIALNGVGYTRLSSICSNLEKDTLFIILRDNDNAGLKAANILQENLDRIGKRNITLVAPYGKDANDSLVHNREDFKNFIETTIKIHQQEKEESYEMDRED